MLRNAWFWVSVVLIVVGVALTVALNVVHWLAAAFALALLLTVGIVLVKAYAVGPAETFAVPQLETVSGEERTVVIYDCDLTMGRAFRNVADGLALLYLMGEPRIDLRAVTTTYGNGPVRATTRTTRRLLDRLGLGHIAVVPGAREPKADPSRNQAARHLANAVTAQPKRIVLVTTGSLTNLKHAVDLDPHFFEKLRSLYLTGGMTGKLTWNRRPLGERNFSQDPEAAYLAIHAECPTTIAPGKAGLTAILRGPQFAALQAMDDSISKLITQQARSWFALTRLWFGDDGFPMWESVTALAIRRPELFEFERAHLPTTVEDLRNGRLVLDPSTVGPVRLVQGVRDYHAFVTLHFAAWQRLARLLEAREEHLL